MIIVATKAILDRLVKLFTEPEQDARRQTLIHAKFAPGPTFYASYRVGRFLNYFYVDSLQSC